MEKKKVFFIMPFEEKFFEVYEMIKMEFGKDFEFSNAGEEGNQQNILKDIIQPIFETDIVIADLTGLNSNVLYELGIAHTFNKKTIIITQDEISILPFDLKSYRVKDYSTHFKKFAELISYLNSNLNGAVDGSISFSNPVRDFLSLEKIECKNWFFETDTLILPDNTEKGFLDFLTEIEEDVTSITTETQTMTEEMTKMTEGTNKSSKEIERVNKNGGSGTASFVRKEAKKVANYIDSFSKNLREHNVNFNALWDKVENNTLGLLENRFASLDSNKNNLISLLSALKTAQQTIVVCQESTRRMKDAMHDNIGFEKSMNQAIKFAKEDLTNYLTFTEKMYASIDKILYKSKFIVGDVDILTLDNKEEAVI
jgi:RNAse (barnase) inhibitor barstar